MRSYVKVFNNVYAPRSYVLTAADRAAAAWLWSGRRAVVGGLSAAALLGSKWVPVDAPVEIFRRQDHAAPGILVRRDVLRPGEITRWRGIPCTTATRTAYDLGRCLPLEDALRPGARLDALIRVDALLNATEIPIQWIAELAEMHSGARGLRQLRQVLAVADSGAESPQESRLRLMLLCGGLPRLTTQIRVGRRRIDMGWPQWKVDIEYDGPQHWTDPRVRADDIDRSGELGLAQWHIERFSSRHLQEPLAVVARAATALRGAGCADPVVLAATRRAG